MGTRPHNCISVIRWDEHQALKEEVERLKSELADTRARLSIAEQYVPRDLE
jgi:AmiR/NasT family two-component response regulator